MLRQAKLQQLLTTTKCDSMILICWTGKMKNTYKLYKLENRMYLYKTAGLYRLIVDSLKK
jgi:hypothetical protein